MEFRRRRPGDDTLRWVADHLGADVVAWRRMTGGIGSAVHRLTVDGGSTVRSVVLRQYEDAGHARWIRREAHVLGALERTEIPAPTLLGADPDGSEAGRPTLLMSRVPGRIDLTPTDPDRWMAQMASTAAAIHDLSIDVPPFEPWCDPDDLTPPSDTTDPAVWRTVHALVRDTAPPVPHVFVHRDFQHFNLLWSRGRLTGVVDWTFSAIGPREVDVGHCCLNLAVLYRVDWATRFLRAYESEAGTVLDPWWLIHAIGTYSDHWPRTIPTQVDGRCAVDLDGMTGRVEELLRTLLA